MSQKEYIGCGKLSILNQIIKGNSVKKILLVTSNYSYHQSEVKDKIQSYLHSVEIAHFFGFSVNPKINEAKKGVDLIKSFNPDIILAIGGGSVIDMAKLINTLAVNCDNNTNVQFIRSSKKNINKGRNLIAIPTTAGTGSEATHFAVVYIDGEKHSIAHQYLLPDYVIIDPTLTYRMPKIVAASSGIDALSQAIESYWAINSTTRSKTYAKKAIKIILPNIVKAVCDKDVLAMDAMALGANLSGKAINISKTTAAHAISYSISTLLNIPHGHSVALTLGNFFLINYPENGGQVVDNRGVSYLKKTKKDLYKLLGFKTPVKCYNFWNELITKLDLENNPYKLGLRENEINIIINNINLERANNNPVKVDRQVLQDIFKKFL